MDNSVSENPDQIDDLSADFGSLNLINSDGNNIKNKYDVAAETSGMIPWSLDIWAETSSKTPWSSDIWGEKFFVTEAEDYSWKPNRYFNDDLPEVEDSGAGSSKSMESFCGYPSMQFEASSSNQHPTLDQSFCGYASMPDYVSNCEVSRFRTGDLYTYDIDESGLPIGYLDHYGNAGTYNYRQEIDASGQFESVLGRFKGRYLSMMTDEGMSDVFRKLVDDCITDDHFNSIIELLFSTTSELLIDAAFCKQGLHSMTKLIERIKKTRHAFTLTNLLSTRFFEIMTDNVAMDVIRQCFIYFGKEPNKILVEKAKHHFPGLAVHKVGCRAINEIIKMVDFDFDFEERPNLLDLVVDHSAHLSNHPYGNYVVQNAMSLKIRDVNSRIVLRLQGKYVELAENVGGSQVVEKCMKLSDNGLTIVIEDILTDPTVPFRLAQDHYGNYVIQTALKMTKEQRLWDLHDSLKKSLLPHRNALNRTPGGLKVVNLIKREDCSQCYGLGC